MAVVTVLGGCGAVGSVAAKTLAKLSDITCVVIADRDLSRVPQISAGFPAEKFRAVALNAEDPASIRNAAQGADIVLNCVGPFYKTVKTVLSTVMDMHIPYVDVCDDVDVTQEILSWDKKAKEKGAIAVIGMGSSPGATNLLAKFAADNLLDQTDSVDIFHAHGGEPFEGPGVIGHRFHCMTIDVPMFLNGKLTYVKFFEPDGIALREAFTFPVIGDSVTLYPYPHPEQVTLPHYIKLNQVTNKGTVLPSPYYDLTRDICALGLHDKTPILVNGREVSPYDFSTAFIISRREKILKDLAFGAQRGCVSVIVKGTKKGLAREYRFHMASKSQALGEGTGIPAAGGALLLARGKIGTKGVLPPEGCINPLDFLGIIPEIMTLDKQKSGGESFGGVIVQEVDEKGNVKDLDI
ncbi:MAG: saccharopine dehydrogenase NADP-binding domain-containing protein [Thermodesulfobacteriota bacterium]